VILPYYSSWAKKQNKIYSKFRKLNLKFKENLSNEETIFEIYFFEKNGIKFYLIKNKLFNKIYSYDGSQNKAFSFYFYNLISLKVLQH